MCRTPEGGGFPIEFRYSAKYEPRLAGEGIDIMQEAIDYCTEHDRPAHLYAGQAVQDCAEHGVPVWRECASGTSAKWGRDYFSDQNLASPDKGADSARVLAHEIIHQWWGLGVSLADMEDANWTDEGMTTYATYRLMAELKGVGVCPRKLCRKVGAHHVAERAVVLYAASGTSGRSLPEAYAAEVKAAADSVNWYDGTALTIDRAEQKIGRERLDAALARLEYAGGRRAAAVYHAGRFSERLRLGGRRDRTTRARCSGARAAPAPAE